jgi:hypothetical protein
MVSFDFAQKPELCRVSDCESTAEFFVFDPATNGEVAHVCMGCFERATAGASNTTEAYRERMAAALEE